AADRLETIRPPYAVVKMKRQQTHTAVNVENATPSISGSFVYIQTKPRTAAVNYALAIASEERGRSLDVAHDLSGIAVEGLNNQGTPFGFPLPHPDFAAAREFTRGSELHDMLWKHISESGTLTLRGQLDLWQMLIPATQPLSKLDYTPEPETVTVTF